jgi:hypothetical protein
MNDTLCDYALVGRKGIEHWTYRSLGECLTYRASRTLSMAF